MQYLSIDVGTTCCKCQLFSESGEILEYLSQEYDFRKIDGSNYVDVDVVWQHCKAMIAKVAKTREISSICISSLGEAFALLDKKDDVLFYPMLYTDPRGEEEAEEISAAVGEERAFLLTGTIPHSMYSLSKLLWIKKHYPDVYAQADKVLLVGEYIGYLLSGKRVIDYGLAARTGALDIQKLDFSEEVLNAVGVERSLFSKTARAGTVVGEIKKELVEELGIEGNPVLVLGSHDQICTSLGAGLLEAGDAVDGMGTVECITTLFEAQPTDVKMGREGYPCVPYAVEGLYCTYILNYSCGSTVNWLRKKIMHGYKGEESDFFTYLEKNMPSAPTGILSLPYFGGAATPYQDINAQGAIVNLTTETTDAEVYKSLMEGTAMEMRLNADVVRAYGIEVTNAVATGGGANSATWLQIKSDIQNIPYKTLRSSEGGLCGCAMLQAVALGSEMDLWAAREKFVRYIKDYVPSEGRHAAYETQYGQYKKLYKMIKEIKS